MATKILLHSLAVTYENITSKDLIHGQHLSRRQGLDSCTTSHVAATLEDRRVVSFNLQKEAGSEQIRGKPTWGKREAPNAGTKETDLKTPSSFYIRTVNSCMLMQVSGKIRLTFTRWQHKQKISNRKTREIYRNIQISCKFIVFVIDYNCRSLALLI